MPYRAVLLCGIVFHVKTQHAALYVARFGSLLVVAEELVVILHRIQGGIQVIGLLPECCWRLHFACHNRRRKAS